MSSNRAGIPVADRGLAPVNTSIAAALSRILVADRCLGYFRLHAIAQLETYVESMDRGFETLRASTRNRHCMGVGKVYRPSALAHTLNN